ncbi:unnamed protein product, partial [Tetraodon nigroviridis]
LSQYTHHHLVAFLLTFFSYVLLHASRKTFSNVKVSISAQWTPPLYNASGVPVEVGAAWRPERSVAAAGVGFSVLVVRLLLTYACWLPQRWNGSALFANEEQATLFLGALDSIFLFSRGFVFGLWSACAPVGNILGAFLASSVLKYGYEYAFLVTAVVQLAGGVVVFFGLLVSPKEVGLSVSETVLSPMDTDAGSHQPLMSDEEEAEEEEVYARRRPALQQPEEPATRSSQAISFWRAFLLPGVLPVSAGVETKQRGVPASGHLLRVCAAVLPGLRLSEAGQLLLLLLAPLLPEQQLWLERGRGRPSVSLVRCRRDHWLAQRPGGKRRPPGQRWLLHRRPVRHDQLRHICRPGQTGSSAGQPGSVGHCHRNRGRNREHRSSCRTGEEDRLPVTFDLDSYLHRFLVSGVADREQAGLDVCVLLLHRHDSREHRLHHSPPGRRGAQHAAGATRPAPPAVRRLPSLASEVGFSLQL